LSYPANEKIPWVVDCVEVRRTEKNGRGIYATQDLKAGDVICIEEPIINYSNEKGRYMRCYNCSKACALNLIPCDQTASMMFCSVPCKENFYLKAFNTDKIASADIKTLADSIAAVSKSVENVDEIIKNMDLKNLNKTIFDFDLSDPNDPEYKKKLMICLLSLSKNDDRVKDTCHIREYVSDKTAQHILSIIKLNRKHSDYRFILSKDDAKDENVGFHICLFASLINHACFSNALCINLDNKVFTIIHKPVKRGEQITVKYTDGISGDEVGDIKQIEELHKFKCECDLCVDKNLMQDPFYQKLKMQGVPNVTTMALENAKSRRNPDLLNSIWCDIYINHLINCPQLHYNSFLIAQSYLKAISTYLTYPFLRIDFHKQIYKAYTLPEASQKCMELPGVWKVYSPKI
jgi:hypothetical protein